MDETEEYLILVVDVDVFVAQQPLLELQHGGGDCWAEAVPLRGSILVSHMAQVRLIMGSSNSIFPVQFIPSRVLSMGGMAPLRSTLILFVPPSVRVGRVPRYCVINILITAIVNPTAPNIFFAYPSRSSVLRQLLLDDAAQRLLVRRALAFQQQIVERLPLEFLYLNGRG